jgi:hypothetical protein
MDWVRGHSAEHETFRWLEAMATNEAQIDAYEACEELTRVLRGQPPPPVQEHAHLLRDLIWEASEPTSEWLTWPSCRVCSRRWAVVEYHGQFLCPRHSNPDALTRYLREEMERYPGLVDHSAKLALLTTRSERSLDDAPPAGGPGLNGDQPYDEPAAAYQPDPPVAEPTVPVSVGHEPGIGSDES